MATIVSKLNSLVKQGKVVSLVAAYYKHGVHPGTELATGKISVDAIGMMFNVDGNKFLPSDVVNVEIGKGKVKVSGVLAGSPQYDNYPAEG